MTRIVVVSAIALALASEISAHAADVSSQAKTAVINDITEMGCSMDVDDDVEADGDGYKTEDVQCKDGQYFMTFDKNYKLTGKKKG
jgi:Flp pilus assembly protein TadG